MSQTNPPKYWRSLGELADTPEFRAQLEAEFPLEESPAGFSRRRMLQLMGASLVLASAGSCRWEERKMLPENKRPENRTPGKFERYATAMELGGSVLGLLVTCVDGRPIKVEGNPKHPNSLGATNAYAQAAILELYDPDRSQHIVEKTNEGDKVRSWEQFSEFAKKQFEEYRKNGGEGLAILSESVRTPTLLSLWMQFFHEFPNAKLCIYDPIIPQVAAEYDLADAEVIVCFDADLFGTHPHSIKYTNDFAKTRQTSGKMSRLYVIESRYSITGAMADHRLSMKSSDIAQLPAILHKAVAEESYFTQLEKELPPETYQFFAAIVEELKTHGTKCVLATRAFGDKQESKEDFADAIELDYLLPKSVSLLDLAQDMGQSKISTLLIVGGNPLYTAPAEIDFNSCLKNVSNSIHLSSYVNETSEKCSWHIPQSHFLESWGELVADGGHYSIQQPLIEPLHGGKSAIELFLSLLSDSQSALEAIRSRFPRMAKIAGKDEIEKRWREILHDDLLKERNSTSTRHRENREQPQFIPPDAAIENGRLEITFHPSPAVYDGRYANLSWLQEMPDPITRLTWDNVALISPATAEKLGVKHEEIVKLKFKGREIEIPAYILPGQADGSVAVTLGYGRTAAGKVGGCAKDGIAPVGVNTYKLRTSDAMYFGVGLTVEPTGRMHPLASVAEHFAIDKNSIAKKGAVERIPELAREATFEEYKNDPEFAKKIVHHPPLESLWDEHKYEGHRWGMAVDLSKCVGCGTCVVACMAENNVPVVGKDRIFKNREMHWLRIDRYFTGDMQNPQIVFQPVMCQQCELAPCEGVCPVGATAHSHEGLNDMVYNRCVGTRYCANNCPYKVRRFNFFNYHKQYEEPANEILKMASNPQVTVRMRGVMEKCTYCVQRIQAAKIAAKNEKRELEDGEIQTACQQACPAGAIVFGDLSDKNSAVSRCLADNRSYAMLEELNTKPRTFYLARIRNPNPKLETTAKKTETHHGDAESTENK